MQTTGIVRRVDELGRIVVPKEIRNNLRIKKGDCLEFFLEDGKIILTKHDVFDKINSVQTLIDIVSSTFLAFSISFNLIKCLVSLVCWLLINSITVLIVPVERLLV